MAEFSFFPELFECRTLTIAELDTNGYGWVSHYSSIDVTHDAYGLEVCGIKIKDDAQDILCILKRLFPSWKRSRLYFKDWGLDPGWKAEITKGLR
jgi:hypothetical protein